MIKMTKKQKFPHTLAVFTNDKLKMFHIWQTSQDNLKNVSVVNALSKARYALSGRLSAQASATSSFNRVVLKESKYWAVEYHDLKDVNKDELQIMYNLVKEDLENKHYKCLTRNPQVRHQTKKYSGRKQRFMLIENMKKDRIESYASNMLEDCVNDNINIQTAKTEIYKSVTNVKSTVNNISELWAHVKYNYDKAA
jgi:hypothetical protein